VLLEWLELFLDAIHDLTHFDPELFGVKLRSFPEQWLAHDDVLCVFLDFSLEGVDALHDIDQVC